MSYGKNINQINSLENTIQDISKRSVTRAKINQVKYVLQLLKNRQMFKTVTNIQHTTICHDHVKIVKPYNTVELLDLEF